MPKIPEGYIQIGFYQPADLWEQVRQQAKAEDRTIQKTVERALREYIERHRGEVAA